MWANVGSEAGLILQDCSVQPSWWPGIWKGFKCLKKRWKNVRKTPSYNYAVYFTGVCTDLSGNDGGDMGVSENRGTPKSSILIGASILNHPSWGTTILGNPHMEEQFVDSIKLSSLLTILTSVPFFVVEAWESRRECPQTQSQWFTYTHHRAFQINHGNSQDLGGAAHTIIM